MLAILITVLAIIADQLTKLAVVSSFSVGDSFTVIGGVLNFTYVRNTGAAWGMLDGAGWLFSIVSGLAVAAIVFYLIKNRHRHLLCTISLSLIMAGAIGNNLLDRVFRGYVVDFIEAAFISFPVFNIADCCITVGAGILLIYVLFFHDKFVAKSKNDTDS